MKKTILIPIILVFLVSLWEGIYQRQKTDIASDEKGSRIIREKSDKQSDFEKCKEQNGTWTRDTAFENDPGHCVLEYSDAWKKCTSSDQCQGGCVTNIISQLGKEWICKKNNSRQGCYNAIESKEFNCLSDDIMTRCDKTSWGDDCESLKKSNLLYE